MRLRVKVEQKHINQGKQCNILFCATALAIKDALEALEPDKVLAWDITRVSWPLATFIHWQEDGTGISKIADFPESVQQFNKDFDFGREVKPFEFELEIKERKHGH